MTAHIMLDLETWGTEPGDDIRSIGACVFEPSIPYSSNPPTAAEYSNGATRFHIACDNPSVRCLECEKRGSCIGCDRCGGSGNDPEIRKYPLRRDPQTVKWWNNQSEEAKGSFANPVDLREALIRFADWFDVTTVTAETDQPQHREHARLWSHGPSFDPPILAAAYAACGLPVPWHYRAPRDTRTALELAGMDPHKGLEPFNTGTHHNALDDAICQARAVCEAYRRLRVPHDVTTHRSRWRVALIQLSEQANVSGGFDDGHWRHELNAFDRTFETLANHPQLEH